MTAYDKAAAARRVAAYIQFLQAAYDTDLDGLADLAGVPPQELAEFAEAPFAEKSMDVLAPLMDLTAISVEWVFGGTPEPVAVPAAHDQGVRAELMEAVYALDAFIFNHGRKLETHAFDALVEIQRTIQSVANGSGGDAKPDTAAADRTDPCTASAGQADPDLEGVVMSSHAQLRVALTALEKFVYAVHEPALDTRDQDLLQGVVLLLNRIADDLDAAIDAI